MTDVPNPFADHQGPSKVPNPFDSEPTPEERLKESFRRIAAAKQKRRREDPVAKKRRLARDELIKQLEKEGRGTDRGATDDVVEQAGLIVGGRRASLDAASTTRPLIRTFADYDPTAPRPPVEAVLRRSDGATVIAARRTTWLSGLPGAGKSWIALMAIVDHCSRGGRALIIDGEMSWNRIAERLALLPDHRPAMEGLAAYVVASEIGNRQRDLAAWVEADEDDQLPGLVIVDSARATGAPADGSSVEEWIAEMIEPYRAAGCSVIVVDHIPKRAHDRPAGPIGSQAKLAMADAALLVSGKAWSRVGDGRVKLTIEKDRDGDLPGTVGTTIATVAGTWRGTDDGRAFHLEVGEASTADALIGNEEQGEKAKEAMLRGVSAAHPEGLATVAVKALAGGVRHATKIAALAALVEEGALHKERVGTSWRYTLPEGDGPDGLPF